ncbi:hypothetical protein SUS17_476 [Sphingomonas sp. S17]|nr:hypothetical protein SUS17_476 [Sphingomonas sp. S17]
MNQQSPIRPTRCATTRHFPETVVKARDIGFASPAVKHTGVMNGRYG